jgi:hypothetical protein
MIEVTMLSKELISEQFNNYKIRIVEETMSPSGRVCINCHVGFKSMHHAETDTDVIMNMAKVWIACDFPNRKCEHGSLLPWTPETLHEWVSN